MSKREAPIQIVDGTWYAVAFRNMSDGADPFTEECCHCGLVHEVEYKVENGRFWVRYTVNKAETRKARARRKRAGKPPVGE